MIVGGNSDDISEGFHDHDNYLRDEGLDFGNVQYKSRVAFIFQKGHPKKTLLVTDVSRKLASSKPLIVRFVVISEFYFVRFRIKTSSKLFSK